MVMSSTLLQRGRERQNLEDDTVHRWYRFVLAYPDHLVLDLLNRFSVSQDDVILDPFCGTGTTLVECKKLGIDSIGMDANPASVFASQVKVEWDIDPFLVHEICEIVVKEVRPVSGKLLLSDKPLFSDGSDVEEIKQDLLSHSPEGNYFVSSGMIERGWIDEIPFYISIALLSRIKKLEVADKYKRLLKLALACCMLESGANVRFGPEIYVVNGSGYYDVLSTFQKKVQEIIQDVEVIHQIDPNGQSLVVEGDARNCAQELSSRGIQQVDFVITSPPYPTEKDYTRNTRLELVYLGFVHDRKSLRRIKKNMIRSHSKGIYKADRDGQFVAHIPEIKAIADELRVKIKDKTYGFAKLYPRIIEEYFGGMYRHLVSLSKVLAPGGMAAYVVGEQCTYLQTYTPTGTILALLAEHPDIDLRVVDMPVWRVRRGTTGSGDVLKEEIVIFQK